jgi:hypothetical protein
MRKSKLLPDGVEMEFEGGLTEEVTAHAGISLLVEVGRRSGVMAEADRVLPGKRNPKGLGNGQMVESFVILSALGGECVDDFQSLRQDQGLQAMVGYEMPAPSTARGWLERCHDEEAVGERPLQGSFIPRESAGLAGMAALVQRTVVAYVAAMKPSRRATLDIDAHLAESTKQEALKTYEGYRGYQPMLVSWAETGLVLADEFRDGNVPASRGIARMTDAAYAALPLREDSWDVRVRSDSAGYDREALDHWDGLGWKFGVSADMSPQLRQEIMSLGPGEWHFWDKDQRDYVREWAEVPYVPSRPSEKKDTQPYRYVGLRVRPPQGVLFSDGNEVKVFAVVSNDWDLDGVELLKWQRGKAGTIEQTNRIIKDELGGGVYPSGKFGANAAWLRLQVITHNLLVLMKATALDEEYRQARPKRLRFAIFNHVGRVVHHAREVFMRVCREMLKKILGRGLKRIRNAAWAAG